MMHAHVAQQGHRYRFGLQDVLALETGHVVLVRVIDATSPYSLGLPTVVKASWLQPLPMRYFNGEVPK